MRDDTGPSLNHDEVIPAVTQDAWGSDWRLRNTAVGAQLVRKGRLVREESCKCFVQRVSLVP